MTCIVGIKYDGMITLGADSEVVSGYIKGGETQGKLFERQGFIYGVCGTVRASNILRYKFEEPKRGSIEIHKYMNVNYVEALTKCLKEAGWDPTEGNEDGTSKIDKVNTEMYFLVGYDGHLFKVFSDLCVLEALAEFDATGSGLDVALGSLHATTTIKPKMKPEEHLTIALEASDTYSVGVRKPFKFIEGGSSG